MKVKTIFLVAAFLLAALLLSGCRAPLATAYPSVTADETTVYLANGGLLYAIGIDSGSQVWQFPEKRDTKKEFYASPVLVSANQVIVPSSGTDHALYSIDPEHRNEKNIPAENWVFNAAADRWIASPILVNGSLYAPNSDGTLYVLDLDGKLQWSLKIGGSLWTQPVTDGKLVYMTSIDHFLYAVDPETKSIAWKADLGATSTSSPAIAPDGNILAGSFNNKLLAFSPAGGNSPIWQQDTKGRIWASPIVSNGAIYVADLDGYVYAFDAATGKPLRDSLQPGGSVLAAPFVWNDLLVVLTETGTVAAYDQDGKIVWKKESGAQLYSTPAATADTLFVPTLGGDVALIAYDRDGKQTWEFKPGK
jgi:outer membrane protein assembly factor BamB